jgi:hypothetical protein
MEATMALEAAAHTMEMVAWEEEQEGTRMIPMTTIMALVEVEAAVATMEATMVMAEAEVAAEMIRSLMTTVSFGQRRGCTIASSNDFILMHVYRTPFPL